jgi:hypothetical protein
MNINKVQRYTLGLLLSLTLACSFGAAIAQEVDKQSYVHEDVVIELVRAVSSRGLAGEIRVRQPSESNCSGCGEDLEIDQSTRFILLSSGKVIDIKMLSKYLPANGQVNVSKVDVSRDGFAKKIQLYK